MSTNDKRMYLVSKTMETTKRLWKKDCKDCIRTKHTSTNDKSVFSEKNNGNEIYLEGLYGMMVHFTGVLLAFHWHFPSSTHHFSLTTFNFNGYPLTS